LAEYVGSEPETVPALVIDGTALQEALSIGPVRFVEFLLKSPAIAVCRCSPSQKENVVKTVHKSSPVITCAVGDGGNDVSMIQAASIGIGIVGKEGKQASLAADCSINTFFHLERMLLWHGSNCYKHSARLAQFVMHRGVIMTVTQAIYSLLYNFVPTPVYNDWLMMGFATVFTNFSVMSLFFDEFISSATVMAFPELYRKCQKGRYLSSKTFIGWTILGIYQGSIILFLSVFLFPVHGVDSRHLQSTAFTSLVLTELGLVALEINHFNIVSIGAEAGSLLMYFGAMLLLRDVFDWKYIFGWSFAWKIAVVTALCIVPLAFFKCLNRLYAPSHEERLMRASPAGPNPAGQFVIL
jgi:phospholipid-translocating ATPase